MGGWMREGGEGEMIFVTVCSLQFLVKKEGFGGGGSRMLQFHQGQGDVPLLKSSGKTLNISIGPGLPSSTSEWALQQKKTSLRSDLLSNMC